MASFTGNIIILPKSEKDTPTTLTVNSIAPTNPVNEQLWIDTTDGNYIIKEYNASQGVWNDISFLSDDSQVLYKFITTNYYNKTESAEAIKTEIGKTDIVLQSVDANGNVQGAKTVKLTTALNMVYDDALKHEQRINALEDSNTAWNSTWSSFTQTNNSFKTTVNSNAISKAGTEEYYISKSATQLTGGSWSEKQPEEDDLKGTNGEYLYVWTRYKNTKLDGTIEYTTPTYNISNTTALQTSDKFSWIVQSGTSSSNMQLTPDFIELAADKIKVNGTATFTNISSELKNYIDNAYNKASEVATKSENGDYDGIGIINTEIKYVMSDDGNNAPSDSSAWSSAMPAPLPNKYIWSRIKFTYTNGNVETMYTVGSIGEVTAVEGEQGLGIYRIVKYYCASSLSSGVTINNVSWKTDITQVVLSQTNRYLWCYEVTEYSKDNGATISKRDTLQPYIKASLGADGDKGDKGDDGTNGTNGKDGKDGKDGETITGITEYYALSNTTTAPAYSSFSSVASNGSAPTPNANNKYLWNYNITTLSSGKTIIGDRRIISNYASDGLKGTGVKSVVREYFVTTDGKDSNGVTYYGNQVINAYTNTISNMVWQQNIPNNWKSTWYLWVRDITTYDNNTTFTSDATYDAGLTEMLRNSVNSLEKSNDAIQSVTLYDTKTSNYSPKYYNDTYGKRIVREIKQLSSIDDKKAMKNASGDSKTGTINAYTSYTSTSYGVLETTVSTSNVIQKLTTDTGYAFTRSASVTATSWGNWSVDNALIASWCSSNNATLINGGAIHTDSLFSRNILFKGTITGGESVTSYDDKGMPITGIIKSHNATWNSSKVLTKGMAINLCEGTIETPYFKLDSDGKINATNGSFKGYVEATNGSFSGKINASSGTIGGWKIGKGTMTDGDTYNYLYSDAEVSYKVNGQQFKLETYLYSYGRIMTRSDTEGSAEYYGYTNEGKKNGHIYTMNIRAGYIDCIYNKTTNRVALGYVNSDSIPKLEFYDDGNHKLITIYGGGTTPYINMYNNPIYGHDSTGTARTIARLNNDKYYFGVGGYSNDIQIGSVSSTTSNTKNLKMYANNFYLGNSFTSEVNLYGTVKIKNLIQGLSNKITIGYDDDSIGFNYRNLTLVKVDMGEVTKGTPKTSTVLLNKMIRNPICFVTPVTGVPQYVNAGVTNITTTSTRTSIDVVATRTNNTSNMTVYLAVVAFDNITSW